MIELQPLDSPDDILSYKQYDSDPFLNDPKLFLAGSIESDTAERWQDKVIMDLEDLNVIILNPRRDSWDNSLEQRASNPEFSNQVNWELNNIESADIISFYFDPKTKSPITLLELGLVCGMSSYDIRYQEIIVCCPDGFWRKGNVEIMCNRFNIQLHNDYNSFIQDLRKTIEDA